MPAPAKVLSVVIPAYNEARFIGRLVEQVRAVDLQPLGVKKEIIVVDDCSRDGTSEIVRAFPDVRLLRHEQNAGKGRAVRTGIDVATGDYLIIQDADLEYDPQDYIPMLQAIISGTGDVVYGSRYMSGTGQRGFGAWLQAKNTNQSWGAYLGGRSLSFAARLFTGTYLTDTVTALKLFPRRLLADMPLETSGFELDHEITARVLARGLRIVEVPVRYFPRGREQGKKIGLKDWFRAVRTFRKYGRRQRKSSPRRS